MDIKFIIIILALGVIIFLYSQPKKKIGKELIVAFTIAFAWAAYYPYDYVGHQEYLIIGNSISLYPLILWTVGLVILREVYEKTRVNRLLRFFYITIAYWLVLGLAEAFGYHILGVRLTTSYPSFLGLGILHIPLLAQLFYIISGPIYLLITDYLKVK